MRIQLQGGEASLMSPVRASGTTDRQPTAFRANKIPRQNEELKFLTVVKRRVLRRPRTRSKLSLDETRGTAAVRTRECGGPAADTLHGIAPRGLDRRPQQLDNKLARILQGGSKFRTGLLEEDRQQGNPLERD
jgi:hypothetical protein